MRETLNDNFPVHYYRGNVDNNNVVFQNFCWKIVRTTSTGGVKLLYNGVVNADGGCNNTGTASQIGTSYFNKFIDGGYSPADTVSESSGGNGFLDYPVGLLTVGESLLADGSMSYLDSGETWWTMSPISYHGGVAGALDVIKHGIVATKFAVSSDSLLGIRPVVSLKQGIEVESGDGTVSSPYKLDITF